MAKGILKIAEIFQGAFIALTAEDYAAYDQCLNPLPVQGRGLEGVVGTGDPSLAEGHVIGVKQQRQLRRKADGC